MDSRNKRSDKNSELYRAITALDSLDDCYDFLVETSASSATISRVNRCLTGGTGGYERAFAKVDAEEKK